MDFDGPAPHGGGPPTLEAQLFALLKPLRGTLVQASIKGAKEIRVVATRREEGDGSILLVIGLASELQTQLELTLGEFSGVVVVNSTTLVMDSHGVSAVQPAILPGGSFIVPPLGTMVIQQELQRSSASAIQQRQVINESFCKDVFNLGLQLGATGRLQLSCSVVMHGVDNRSTNYAVRFGIKGPANNTEWSISVRGMHCATVVPNYFVEVPISSDLGLPHPPSPTASFLEDTPFANQLTLAFECTGDSLVCGAARTTSTMTFVSVVSRVMNV